MASISVVAVYPKNDQPHIVKRISGTHCTNQLKLRTGSDESLRPPVVSQHKLAQSLPAEQKFSRFLQNANSPNVGCNIDVAHCERI